MKRTNEIVQKINHWYVGDDCVQLMVPYKNSLTILNKDGILYHHKDGSENSINCYINDERRKQFPYSNIPIHNSKLGLFDKCHYTNQLFNFEQPYIRIGDYHLIESYAIRENNEALVVNRILPVHKKTVFKTRDEVEKLFEQPSDNKRLYVLNMNGEIGQDSDCFIADEIYINQKAKEWLTKNVADFRNYFSSDSTTSVGNYLKKNPVFLDFIESSLNTLDLNSAELYIHILNFSDGNYSILVEVDGKDIKIKAVDIYFIKNNYYKVDEYDIPVTKYTLEQLKTLATKLITTKEPIIPLKLNPNISKEDIKEAKKMVKSIKQFR